MIGNMVQVHTLRMCLDWSFISTLSTIDRFQESWSSIEKKEQHSLKQLKQLATISSVGASTRIEGAKMSDKDVELLLQNLSISKLIDRDAQEVAGYYDVLEIVISSYPEIFISESTIKDLHNRLLKYSGNDEWHRGKYKQQSNRVEARLPDGTVRVVFETTPPGYQTADAMNALFKWYYEDTQPHPLVKIALFTYEFLSIHPFQDGNGRLSRLITTLLLLKHGYSWIQYISFEQQIERTKIDYYQALRTSQANRPNEDVTSWIYFFFNSLISIQRQLSDKLKTNEGQIQLSPKERSVLVFIQENPGVKSGEIAEKLLIPNPTIKKILNKMIKNNLIEKFGVGPGTNYSIH